MEKYIAPKINKVDGMKYLKNIIEYYEKQYYNLSEYHYIDFAEIYKLSSDDDEVYEEELSAIPFEECINEDMEYILIKKEKKSLWITKAIDIHHKLEIELLYLYQKIIWDKKSLKMFDKLNEIHSCLTSSIKGKVKNYQENMDVKSEIKNKIRKVYHDIYYNVIDEAPVILRNPNDYEQWI